MLGQQRRMELDRPVPRDRAEGLRHERQHVGHDGDVGVERAQPVLRLGVGVARVVEDRDAALLGGGAQRVGPGARRRRRDEGADHDVPAGDEAGERGAAERLLPDDRDPHSRSGVWAPRRAS